MPRSALDLTNPEHLALVGGQWRFGPGLVPGEPNQGLVALLENSPARLPDYDDSSWEVIDDIGQWRSSRLTFGWYRTKLVIPEQGERQGHQGRPHVLRDLYRRLRRSLGERRDRSGEGIGAGFQHPAASPAVRRDGARRRIHHSHAGHQRSPGQAWRSDFRALRDPCP